MEEETVEEVVKTAEVEEPGTYRYDKCNENF